MLLSFNTYKGNIFDIHIFYKQSQDGNTGTGYIIDRFGKNKVKVSEPDMIFAFLQSVDGSITIESFFQL
jgi:hypothetical protein